MENTLSASMFPRFALELDSQGRSAGTIKVYRYVIARYEATNSTDPMAYLAGLRSRAMRAYHGIVLRRYFAWCMERGYLARNPLDGLSFRPPAPDPPRPFTRAEIECLLSACHTGRERAVVLTLYDTGVRASELCGLRQVDVLEGGVLRVMGKGRKVRMVAASKVTLAALRAVRSPNGLVLGGLTYRGMYDLLARLGERAGVAEVRPHRFRHSFAHAFLAAGGDIGDLRVLLGHSSFAMTMRYCAFYEAERAVAAGQRFSPVARLENVPPNVLNFQEGARFDRR